jgi:hypothetical protein
MEDKILNIFYSEIECMMFVGKSDYTKIKAKILLDLAGEFFYDDLLDKENMDIIAHKLSYFGEA